ncbi:MAG: carboxyl transferase domain-containing protein, partial [Haloarculaceae archaeon]
MDIRIGADATEEEAAAVAAALAGHIADEVAVYLGDETEPAVRSAASGGADAAATEPDETEDLGPTERERQLLEEIADIERGGPEKYKARLADQGKLFVRDRLDLWFGDDGLKFEDGRFAEFESDDRLPADGLLTGAAEFEGRDVHFMANDFTVKAGSMAEK